MKKDEMKHKMKERNSQRCRKRESKKKRKKTGKKERENEQKNPKFAPGRPEKVKLLIDQLSETLISSRPRKKEEKKKNRNSRIFHALEVFPSTNSLFLPAS